MIIAAFKSECSWCSEEIIPGDEIEKFTHPTSKTTSWFHMLCYSEAEDIETEFVLDGDEADFSTDDEELTPYERDRKLGGY